MYTPVIWREAHRRRHTLFTNSSLHSVNNSISAHPDSSTVVNLSHSVAVEFFIPFTVLPYQLLYGRTRDIPGCSFSCITIWFYFYTNVETLFGPLLIPWILSYHYCYVALTRRHQRGSHLFWSIQLHREDRHIGRLTPHNSPIPFRCLIGYLVTHRKRLSALICATAGNRWRQSISFQALIHTVWCYSRHAFIHFRVIPDVC